MASLYTTWYNEYSLGHFEARLISLSSKAKTPKYSGWQGTERDNGNLNITNFRLFFFEMNSNAKALKVPVFAFASDLEF